MKVSMLNSSLILFLVSYLFIFNRITNSLAITKTIKSIRFKSKQLSIFQSSYQLEDKSKQQFSLGKIAFSLVPLSPESIGRRKTILKEVVPGSIWTLDQVQGIINVNVPVRSTIIKLSSGGLFVNNPVAPTDECVELMRNLEAKHGKVKYVVLSSLALEHKGTTGAFSAYFPSASVYVQPGQFSFPVNLPTAFYFPLGKAIKEIPADSKLAPWYDDIDHVSLNVRPSAIGGFAETAFFHRSSKTLLVTDAIVKVEDSPPEIIQDDPRALLYHSRDTMLQVVEDSPSNRQKGWRRMVLFGLVFFPSCIEVPSFRQTFAQVESLSPEMRRLGEGVIPFDAGLYFDDKVSFENFKNRLVVAPVLQQLLLNREPEKVMDWAKRVSRWPFTRIIPCHLANDIKATPKDFIQAFDFLYEPVSSLDCCYNKKETTLFSRFFHLFQSFNTQTSKSALNEEVLSADLSLLTSVSAVLSRLGILYKPPPLIKRN